MVVMLVRLEIVSSDFIHNHVIPRKHTCDGEDLPPGLSWDGAPKETISYALVLDDPDAPGGIFTHWIIFNIAAEARGLPSGIAKVKELPSGILQGVNDFGRVGYGGPCPPAGMPHRYIFHLYALDMRLNLQAGLSKT